MTLFQLLGLVTTVVAIFGYINHRFIRLPDTLGITAVGLIVSTALILVGHHEPKAVAWAEKIIDSIDFPEVVFHGMLPLLLFAGSLHVNIAEIAKEKATIFLLSTVGVVVSTLAVGYGMFYALDIFGVRSQLIYCLLFGALISPTDPVVIIGVLKKVGVDKRLETQISGESLFNDGTAVVAFLLLLGISQHTSVPNFVTVGSLLLNELLGAIVVGLGAGYLAVMLLRGIDSYPVEILITLSLATAGYGLAESAHASAPLAVVVMGLVIGNLGAAKAMSEKTRMHVFNFWELIDELLNLILFGLIGVEVIALDVTLTHLWVGAVAVVVVLFARWLSVVVPLLALSPFQKPAPNSIRTMTWGGLRGGISIALALSLPPFHGRDLVLGATYVVVLFSLLVQATTLGGYLQRLAKREIAP